MLNRYKRHLRVTTGRATEQQVAAVRAQLDNGGDADLFVVSAFSKAVAQRILPDAPLGDFLKSLLSGNHQLAAQVAWRHARLARDDSDYAHWTKAVAFAVRCQDQTRSGRADKFIHWVNGQQTASGEKVADGAASDANPLAEFLVTSPIPYQIDSKALQQAAAYLNGLTVPRQLDTYGPLGAALPDNDVLLVGGSSLDTALSRYRLYLRRQTGRSTDSELKAVRRQLEQGGEAEPFVVSEASVSLSNAITDDAPLAGFLRPLLKGQHAQAAKVAWSNARLADNVGQYENWIEAVQFALRCHDQSCLRGEQLQKWTRGEPVKPALPQDTIPAEDILGRMTIPFSATESARHAALKRLNYIRPEALKSIPLAGAVPGNDVALVFTSSPADASLHYGNYLRRTEGRAEPKLAAFTNQLREGGSLQLLVVSPEAKALASKISATAPMSAYLRPLLAGDHQGAAKTAWQAARQADSDEEYDAWIEAIAVAIRCHDKAYSGRADDFIAWTQGTLKGADGKPVMANPIAGFLGE